MGVCVFVFAYASHSNHIRDSHHTHTRTHTLARTLTHTDTHSPPHRRTHSHAHSPAPTHKHTGTQTHTHRHACTHTQRQAHLHTSTLYTQARTLFGNICPLLFLARGYPQPINMRARGQTPSPGSNVPNPVPARQATESSHP